MGAMYIVQVHGAIYVHRGLGFLASTVVAIVGYQLIELHIIITPQKKLITLALLPSQTREGNGYI